MTSVEQTILTSGVLLRTPRIGDWPRAYQHHREQAALTEVQSGGSGVMRRATAHFQSRRAYVLCFVGQMDTQRVGPRLTPNSLARRAHPPFEVVMVVILSGSVDAQLCGAKLNLWRR